MKQGYGIILKQTLFMKSIIANLINRFGDSVDAIAFSWMVYELTNSAGWSAIVLGVNLLPNILIQPFAGAIVERLAKKKTIIFCDVSRGILTAIILILFCNDLLSPWLLLIITFLNNTFESFRSPACTCVVPMILPKEHFEFGLSFSQSSNRVCELIALGLAGVIIATFGIAGAIIIDMISFFLCAMIIANIPLKEYIEKSTTSISSKVQQVLSDLTEGFRYLVKKNTVFLICMIACVLNMALVPLNSFQAPYVSGILHAPAYVLSIMSMAISIGITIGAFIYPYLHKFISNRMILLYGGVVIGIYYIELTVIATLSSTLWVSIALAIVNFIFGVFIGLMIALSGVTFMQQVEESYMARATAIHGAISMMGMPLLSFVLSALCEFVGIIELFIFFGVFTILVFVGMMFLKSIKQI